MTNRKGMSMVEILVALSVFGVSAVGIAQLAMKGSTSGSLAAGSSQQSAMLLSEFSRATAVPAAASMPGVTCDTIPLRPWNFERCTRVTNLNSREQGISVVVQPVGTPASTSVVDGVTVNRAATQTNAPFRAESLTVVRASNVGALAL